MGAGSSSRWKPASDNELQPLPGALSPLDPTVASMVGEWVGRYEFQAPNMWKVHDGGVYHLSNIGTEHLQGFLASAQWLDRRTRQPVGDSIISLNKVSAIWSDGD